MLSIGKMTRGAEKYYLTTVAGGVEDYYLGAGEAPGRWIGQGAVGVGLAGTVAPHELRAALDARHPATGISLIAEPRSDRLPGFDLTFSAPKGVSLLFALAEPAVAREVRRAHDAAVVAALGYLEREAGEVRRGRDGVTRLAGGGFVAAAFRHRTSRAGDPQLHTHVLVANITRGADGRFSALDGRQLYLQAKTAGTLYQTALRHELRGLGLGFRLRANGQCELADVPVAVLRAFSRRRVEIEDRLAERGESSRSAAEVAALATRKAKNYGVRPESLAAEWRGRAAALGFDAGAIRQLLGRCPPQTPGTAELARAAGVMLGGQGLTARSSSFDRRDVLRAWCAELPGGAPVVAVERLADRLLSISDVIALDQPAVAGADRPGAVRSFRRHSTAELLAVESRVIGAALDQRGAGRARVDEATLAAALVAYPGLTDEQATMVRQLTSSGHGVEVVIGKAGTGKTTALAAARLAWHSAGIAVLGARAAVGLTEGAGLPAVTVARLLVAQRRRPAGALPALAAGSVLVVDEAGMLGTRQLDRLLAMTTAVGAKLVLVGDHRQLPELAAGGTFRALAERLDRIELTVNRRQVKHWERSALDQLRDGDQVAGLAAYVSAGRVDSQRTAADQRMALVRAWWAASFPIGTNAAEGSDAVMLAIRRADVVDLNEQARLLLCRAGRLGERSVEGAAPDGRRLPFAVGDQVVARRNDYRAGLVNGGRGVITGVDPPAGQLTVRFGDKDVDVSRDYLDTGGLDRGYALTVHQAQGLTVDRAFLLGSAALYREAGYVGLSRGRQRNELFLAEHVDDFAYEDASVEPPHARPREREDAVAASSRAMARSRAQQAGVDLRSELSRD